MNDNRSEVLKNNAIKMFEELKKHIGERVIYEGWWYGIYENDYDTLREVNPFNGVSFDSKYVPFVGYGFAIKSIRLASTNKVLYENPYIELYYDRRKPEDVDSAQRDIYGDEVVNVRRQRRTRYEQESKRHEEILNLKAQKKKYVFIKRCLSLVKEETKEEWKTFVENNTKDFYSCAIVERSLYGIIALSKGANCEDLEKYYEDVTGFMAGAIANAISHFSPRGEEYRTYWNKKFGVDDSDSKGTVNPAILTIK